MVKIIDEAALINSLDIAKGRDITFLLGAGCSISSGCMGASQLIFEFKKRIYCANKGISLNSTNFMDENRLKKIIDNEFLNDKVSNPYSYYFEKCFPDYKKRSSFIKEKFQEKKPSFGYLCFADYIISKEVNNVLTTNFDLMIERAVRKLEENYDLVNVSENETPIISPKLNIIKLHGDYNYDKIKNTEDELKSISKDLADRLYNLNLQEIVVLGYSGQDDSVMSFLEAYIKKHPDVCIYWCDLMDVSNLNEKVSKLLSNSNHYYVKISGFDSLFEKYYKMKGSNNRALNDIYAKNENNNFELSVTNQIENFKLNAYPIYDNARVYRTSKENQCNLDRVYFKTEYKNYIYFISDKYLLDTNDSTISICNLYDEDIPITNKCKLIKELVKWHLSKNEVLIFEDNVYKDNNEQIKEGLRINVEFFNNQICLVLNPNYFVISNENNSDYQKSMINRKKSNLYTKQSWEFLNNQIKLIFNNEFNFGDSNINVSFSKLNLNNEILKNNYEWLAEPIMAVDKAKNVNQIKILNDYGPKETLFSIDEIKVGVICCDEDKEKLCVFLNEVQYGTQVQGIDLIPTYSGFEKIFKKKIKFEYGYLPKFNLNQLKSKMSKAGIQGIIKSYLNACDIIYKNGADLVLIYISNNLAFIRKNEEIDFHNNIKLRAANKYKTQFLEEKTITSNDNRSKILYNFAIGIYTKTVGMPWYPAIYSKNTLFLGMSFGRDSNGICVGCSQMFDAAGRGMQLIISQVSDKKRKNQYLSEDEAFELGKKIKYAYYKNSKPEPLDCIVIHRNSQFKKEEIQGFKRAFTEINDFVLIQIIEGISINVYPFNQSLCNGYPIKRGTILKASKNSAYVWTDGSVVDANICNGKTYRNSKRGMGRPLKIIKFYGKTSINQVVSDLLYLTKMDFNSSDVLYSKLPVTLKYSNVVCDLIKDGNFDDDEISFEYVM